MADHSLRKATDAEKAHHDEMASKGTVDPAHHQLKAHSHERAVHYTNDRGEPPVMHPEEYRRAKMAEHLTKHPSLLPRKLQVGDKIETVKEPKKED